MNREKFMKTKPLVIGLIVILVAWQLYSKYGEIKKEQEDILSKYTTVQAIINRVTPSGIRNKRSTILMVDYEWDKKSRQATIRKNGYSENRYKIGDIIIIYVNPTDLTDIR